MPDRVLLAMSYLANNDDNHASLRELQFAPARKNANRICAYLRKEQATPPRPGNLVRQAPQGSAPFTLSMRNSWRRRQRPVQHDRKIYADDSRRHLLLCCWLFRVSAASGNDIIMHRHGRDDATALPAVHRRTLLRRKAAPSASAAKIFSRSSKAISKKKRRFRRLRIVHRHLFAPTVGIGFLRRLHTF